MSQLTPRVFAKRWAWGVRKGVFGYGQMVVALGCARDIEFALRTAGEDTRWLRRYIDGVAKARPRRPAVVGTSYVSVGPGPDALTDRELLQLARLLRATRGT